ncbi:MAG: DUF3320 domain-containing protein [Baekduia sp.]
MAVYVGDDHRLNRLCSPDRSGKLRHDVETSPVSDLKADDLSLVETRLEDWRRRLIDLSHRNRLIAYKATQATTLEIVTPSLTQLLADPSRIEPWDFYLPPEPDIVDEHATSDAAATVDELLVRSQDRRRVRRSNEIEVTEPNPKRIARILDNLAKRSNTEFQDKALRILYIAAGFLDWHDAQRDKPISSPLVLVPVELRRNSARDPYRMFFVDDEEVVINPSLTEKLRRDAGLDVPGDWVWEDKPIAQELDEIRRAVQPNGWTVREDAVLGLFSFQKYVMYRDLLDHESQVSAHPLVRSLAQGRLSNEVRGNDPAVPALIDLDEEQQPAETLSILDADASQRQCVEAAKRGRSFVMQGPPGTGKSQTIANVIAEAIGQGKRILFVSEKAAALDVVFKRLAASGLDEYCLMLHGEHAGRREVVQALDRSLTSSLQPRPGMRDDELDRLANLRLVLNDSAELLHLPAPLLGGRTLRDVHEQLAGLHDFPSMPGAPPPSPIEGAAVLDEYQSLSEIFSRLAERWHVSPSDFPWRGYAATRFTADDHGQALAALRELKDATHALERAAASVAGLIGVPSPMTLTDARELVLYGEHLGQAPVLQVHWLDLDPSDLAASADDAQEAYRRLRQDEASFAENYPARELDDFSSDIEVGLQRARDEVQRRCGWSSAWESDLDGLGDALRALDELPAQLARTRERAVATASLIGQPADALTVARMDALSDLAELAFGAERRPERDWLVRAGLTRAEDAHKAVAADLADYQRQRAALMESYRPAALELDAGPIGERFATQYTSVFSRLSGTYRHDAKAIKAVRHDGKLPDDVVGQMALIVVARATGQRIDDQADRLSGALGSYHAGRDTDPEAVSSAIDVARAAVDLSAPDADLKAVGDALATGSTPDPALAQAADQLRDARRSLHERFQIAQRFISKPSHMASADLDEVQRVLGVVEGPIRALAALITDLDSGASAPASSYSQVAAQATQITEALAARESVVQASARWQMVIGSPFEQGATDFDAVRRAAQWLTTLTPMLSNPLPAPVRQQLGAAERDWPELSDVRAGAEAMRSAVARFTGLFDVDRNAELDALVERHRFAEVRELCALLVSSVDLLGDWTEWRSWRQRASRKDWDGFVTSMVQAKVDQAEVVAAFQRAYWNRRLEAHYDDEPDLAEDLRGGAFRRWVEEFRELDRKLVRTGADRLIVRRERNRASHVATPGSEIELLRREARKKIRHLPVRILLSRIPTLLSELKPCLMMSPLTVSHFLSADHTFDLVVFDEASQVPPQDAINCIYRGSQLVVAGDSKQLPPTPFFQIAELDELAPEAEDASTQEDMESVLDACESLLPGHPLLWHYRSRSEPLISFSNRYIYNGSLMTFPSAEHRSERTGVGFVYVADGVYDRGRTASNRREAKVVAQRVMDHLLDGSGRSLGVIAFNTAQANAIADELDLLKVRHPELEQHFRGDRLDDVFVKHLEAVQGDERDVILFSVGYGKDGDGKFTTNFGPLNKDGGQRRLNVAVTRARERVELIASVRSHDFQLSEGASAGARMLRDYIAYAEADGQFITPDQVDGEGVEWSSALDEQIAEAVAQLGYEAVPSVGVGSFRIDIGVRSRGDAGRFLLGIECDSQSYAQTPTARDRERLRHEVLAGLGWGPIHRIWSLDWVRNRTAEIDRLREALAEAEQRVQALPEDETASLVVATADEDGVEGAPRERAARIVHELGSVGAAAALPWTETYVRATLGNHHSGYEFHESANRRLQTDLLIELLSVEAPIAIDYAIRRLAECWGLQRAGHRVVSAGRQAISQAGRRDAVEVRGEFLWRPGQTLTAVRVPDVDVPGTRREIEEIPPEELDLAIARLREASAGLDDEQIISQVARVLGFDRTGGRIRAVLQARLGTHPS